MLRRWTARRCLISAFLIFHTTATAIWTLPPCPIRTRAHPYLKPYIFTLGLWQFWAMFAPDPAGEILTLEAEVIDARGLRHRFEFPRVADYSLAEGVVKFRHSKYAANLGIDEFDLPRKYAARHAVRALNVPADAFPLDVHLIYRVQPMPPPGSPPDYPKAPTRPSLLATFTFANPGEVWP